MAQDTFPHLNKDNNKTALVEGDSSYSYAELNQLINRFATGLLAGKADLHEERIALFMPASVNYVTTLHGIWRAGGVAIPLNVDSTSEELNYYLSCARVTRLVTTHPDQDYLPKICGNMNVELLSIESVFAKTIESLPSIDPDRRAMMLFTSGTSNKPKGVVSTHKNIHAQISTLIDAWAWTKNDSIPLFLPVHHIHGIINILSCGLWSGASIHLFQKFHLEHILKEVVHDTYSLFMAVPTIYVKIIRHLESLDRQQATKIGSGFRAMRLNISGSAACPVKTFDQWKKLTGQALLERYGMTEIGMAISNPYAGVRRAGFVGQALSGVDVSLFDEDNNIVTAEGTPAEIRIKGGNVFLEYWDNPKATKESFRDGWFLTGDIAVLEDGYYRIMGRSSIDIIKSGGYKLSALEIEGILLTHDNISECAVIGVESEVWGESVTAFIVLKPNMAMEYSELKAWCRDRMSSYKIPKQVKVVESLPRNSMGKVVKPNLRRLL